MAKENIKDNLLKMPNKIRDTQDGILPEKQFKPRNSLLTDLFEIKHFKSIRHLFIALLICSLISNILNDNFGSGSTKLGFRYIKIGFGQFHRVILIWLLMFSSALAAYPLFSVWANFRIQLSPKSAALKLWDKLWLSGILIYYTVFLCVPPYIKGNHMPAGSSAVILCEQIRLLMKTHAFVRSTVPRVRSYHSHADREAPIPVFSKYLYFLFVPTLIYRDSYPRTKEIRLSFVLSLCFDMSLCLVFLSIAFGQGLLPEYRNYRLELNTWKTIMISICNVVPTALIIIFVMFYLVVHCWLNAWAELLTFADRQFYSDWWNVTSFSAYYRKWSSVIHDFLHAYIYRDFYETIVPGNKVVSAVSVFVISAIVHEYIATFILGFFYPVLLIQFLTFGMFLTFIKLNDKQYFGNVFFWWALVFGYAMQISLYAMEYYARFNCPKENVEWSDFFIPRSWSC